jgi:hypothetical protein
VSLGCLWDDDDDDDDEILRVAEPYFWSPKFVICAQVTCVIVPRALLAVSVPNINIPEELVSVVSVQKFRAVPRI